MPEYLTVEEVAELVRAPVATIYQWNHKGTGPRPRKVGVRNLYRRDEVLEWIEGQQVTRPVA